LPLLQQRSADGASGRSSLARAAGVRGVTDARRARTPIAANNKTHFNFSFRRIGCYAKQPILSRLSAHQYFLKIRELFFTSSV